MVVVNSVIMLKELRETSLNPSFNKAGDLKIRCGVKDFRSGAKSNCAITIIIIIIKVINMIITTIILIILIIIIIMRIIIKIKTIIIIKIIVIITIMMIIIIIIKNNNITWENEEPHVWVRFSNSIRILQPLSTKNIAAKYNYMDVRTKTSCNED